MELTATDREILNERGISEDEVARQLDLLRSPPPPTRLHRACQVGDGILRLEPDRRQELASRYRRAADSGRFGKFVPASGAATRMFRDLLAIHHGEKEDPKTLSRLVDSLDRFAFGQAVHRILGEAGIETDTLETAKHGQAVLQALLEPEGLGYADIPKGLVLFHRDEAGARSAVEEHLRESAELVGDARGRCRVHFTVPTDHRDDFLAALEAMARRIGEELGVEFLVTTSIQKPSTDTLAADLEGEPFRLSDGRLLFRPGGHGALIGNLAELDGDLVFIKNIDNILPQDRRAQVVHWKQVLGGLLIELDERIAEILRRAEAGDAGLWLEEALGFAQRLLGLDDTEPLLQAPAERQRRFLVEQLDRPLRICGVVPNTGEPGGGPFWVEDESGRLSRQIVEPAQVDRDDADQAEIFLGSTHFNPVDVVCRLRSHRGQPYPLERYVDPRAAFVTRKSLEGRPLVALERPGLWNGAMARWNTLFVEVPGETFAPVKTVFDLLRPEHQPREEPL